MEIPAELRWLAWIVGQDWPEGDETALRRLAEAWDDAADGVTGLTGDLQAVATGLLGAVDGPAADRFRAVWDGFVTTGPHCLPSLAELCHALAEQCRDGANDIEYGKYMFTALLVTTAIEILTLVQAAAVTFGASTAAIPAVETAAQVASRSIARHLLAQVLASGARGALSNVGIDLLVQHLQIVQGNRAGLDLHRTGVAALDGAVSGAVSGATSGLVGATGVGPGPVREMTGADTRRQDLVRDAAREGASGAVFGATSTVVTTAAHGGDLTAESLARGATSGAVAGSGTGDRDGPRAGQRRGSGSADPSYSRIDLLADAPPTG